MSEGAGVLFLEEYVHAKERGATIYVPNHAVNMPIKYPISNGFGFGGHNAVLAFKKFSK